MAFWLRRTPLSILEFVEKPRVVLQLKIFGLIASAMSLCHVWYTKPHSHKFRELGCARFRGSVILLTSVLFLTIKHCYHVSVITRAIVTSQTLLNCFCFRAQTFKSHMSLMECTIY